MKKEINIDKIIKKHSTKYLKEGRFDGIPMMDSIIKEVVRDACEQTVKLCAEEANWKFVKEINQGSGASHYEKIVDKKSILKVKNKII
jgi:hypothetical protein